jgi:sarcosine/dimethylglycine N-methyltransferase
MTDPRSEHKTVEPVTAFYDAHPINEEQILRALERRGISPGEATEAHLLQHDQDHYGGVEAVDALARKAGIRSGHHVLDVCSGMGGPARYLAYRYGCHVTGLDFTLSRHEAAQRLTRMVKLEHLVDFCHGDAQAMPFSEASFDVVLGQEAWAHVPNKGRLVGECARVVKPGGAIAFTDIVRLRDLPAEIESRLAREMTFSSLETQQGYCDRLKAAGCVSIEAEDLSSAWTAILQQRLMMYRGLREDTVHTLGAAHYERYDVAYSFFVGLYQERMLGGVRIVARRAG